MIIMFKCDYKKLTLYFNEFHNVEAGDLPQYGEFCLLELTDGRYTAGEWHLADYNNKKSAAGKFIRGTADTVDASEVSRWHSLKRYDLTNCLEDEDMGYINLGPEDEDTHTVQFKDFRSLKDNDSPKSEQYCLLIRKNGELGAGRWEQWNEKNKGCFIYAPALASYSMEEVWAWTPLSSDDIFSAEEEREEEKRIEKELNKNPTADPEKFRYGTDIDVYYEKALEKLRLEYPWATLTQMKKKPQYLIVPRHGQYVFGQDDGTYMGEQVINEWKDGSTAEDFIDFLCEYTREAVQDSEPDVKFKYGMDIEEYLTKAFQNVKRDYRWLDKKHIKKSCHYEIKQINGDWEFVRYYGKDYHILNCGSAESFIESVEYDYQQEALRVNPVTAQYDVPFGGVEIHGWHLERYTFLKLRSGDYKVEVQAGDRVTGGSREFFITPYCFEAKTYGEFLDRYLEIVPGGSFGLGKKDLFSDNKLKKFLGYSE